MFGHWNNDDGEGLRDKGIFPMTAFLNTLADGNCILLDATFDPQHAVKDALDARQPGEELANKMRDVIKKRYFISNVAVFGGSVEAVSAAAEWVKAQAWKRSFAICRFHNSGEEVIRTFSFLSADSTFKASLESFSNIPHQINEYLFLGDYSCATNPMIVDQLGVRHIVNASGGFSNAFSADKVRYLEVNIWDTPSANIAEHFEAAIAFIDEARKRNERVLSHCAAGISRSTSIVLAYLMAREGMTLRAAFLHVKGIRSIVQPNCGFVKQLIAFEKEVHGTNSVLMPVDHRASYFGLSELIRLELEQTNSLTAEMKRVLDD
jgi:hypothetical protein